MTDRAMSLFELIKLQAEAEAMAGGVGRHGRG